MSKRSRPRIPSSGAGSEYNDAASIISLAQSSESEFELLEEESTVVKKGAKRVKITKTTAVKKKTIIKKIPKQAVKGSSVEQAEDAVYGVVGDIEDSRPHGHGYHDVDGLIEVVPKLLEWFEEVREKRQMPWRKVYVDSLSMEEKGQRAYEIWVSEIMLQQTQVTTVIPYWKRWIEKWPTILDLAKADIEEVNSAWRGLGYYRRAKNLLLGAQRIANNAKYNGRLPDDPAVLEKDVEGVGRYTAGAICSMAYGVKTPIIDGNIHRLLSRLLALYAPPTSPPLIKELWKKAGELVECLADEPRGVAGDLNQALMELGSQVCKPANPDCGNCPMKSACKAYAETQNKSANTSPLSADACSICSPVPSSETIDVALYPMKKLPKAQREESTGVMVVKWVGGDEGEGDERWLVVKRPDKGLLAGLFEPPSIDISSEDDLETSLSTTLTHARKFLPKAGLSTNSLSTPKNHGTYIHVFSHIKMTYHLWETTYTSPGGSSPDLRVPKDKVAGDVVWLDREGLREANVGTGVKKMWEGLEGTVNPWTGEKGKKAGVAKVKGSGKAKAKVADEVIEGRVKKKVMMPGMPVKPVEG